LGTISQEIVPDQNLQSVIEVQPMIHVRSVVAVGASGQARPGGLRGEDAAGT
jgi:hypothetical protein